MIGLFSPCAFAERAPPPLQQLSDSELIADYEAAGTALTGTSMMPGAELTSRMGSGNASFSRLEAGRMELLRRGRECVPELNVFLEQEAPKQRNPTNPKENLSFTGDILGLLAQIGDYRSALIAVKILSGWEGQVGPRERNAALRALERLTYVSFYTVRPHMFDYRDCVEHKDAEDRNSGFSLDKTALAYKIWLKGEGKDPAQWLPMAVGRAHELLGSENLDQVYRAGHPSSGLPTVWKPSRSRLIKTSFGPHQSAGASFPTSLSVQTMSIFPNPLFRLPT